MNNQPIINIGVIGHVSDGKSTIVECLTGIKTQKYSDERDRNCTIRLGYANMKIAKCLKCKAPECYKSFSSDENIYICNNCKMEMELMTHVSFIDAPGHNILMQVMLNGTSAMDYTMLIESAVNIIPAPQTIEHYIVTKKMEIPNSIICMNKIDLVKKNEAKMKIEQLMKFLDTKKVVIPVSGTLKINIDILCEMIANLPKPKRDLNEDLKMIIIRSFNINMPGINIKDIQGGVIGGSIIQGQIKIGDTLIIYPGHITKKLEITNNSIWNYKPLTCKVLSIKSDKREIERAIPGGLIGIQLDIDPSLTTNDNMIGQIITNNIKKGDVYESITIKIELIDELRKGIIIKNKDNIIINVNANNIECEITEVINEIYIINMLKPIYIQNNDKITICKKVLQNIYIIGIGTFIDGIKSEIIE